MKLRIDSCAAACAAALCSLFSLHAFGQATIERAHSVGVQAGLERALKTPLEIVWLRTAAEVDMWRHPALAQAARNCLKPGDTKQGCTIVARTAWRYVFGGNVPFAGTPNEVARLLVSSLNLPEATLSAGRLNLAGSGLLYVLTSETTEGAREGKGAVVLAAGSILQLVDAAFPSIQIELKAPQDQPLLLGNLAAADISKVLALLVKPSAANASEAGIDARGRVGLRSGGAVQLASILDLQGQADQMPANAKEFRVEPAIEPAQDLLQVAGSLEIPAASAGVDDHCVGPAHRRGAARSGRFGRHLAHARRDRSGDCA